MNGLPTRFASNRFTNRTLPGSAGVADNGEQRHVRRVVARRKTSRVPHDRSAMAIANSGPRVSAPGAVFRHAIALRPNVTSRPARLLSQKCHRPKGSLIA